ncbi:hypothetical protein BDW75DRAFT_206558 [Aspergillus navahoensis]
MTSRAVLWTLLCSWYIDQALTAWLLHSNVHSIALQLSDMVLKNNIIGGLLTIFYQLSLVITLFTSAFVFSKLLIIRLRKQERIKQALRGLAESTPITYLALEVVGQQITPSIMGF